VEFKKNLFLVNLR